MNTYVSVSMSLTKQEDIEKYQRLLQTKLDVSRRDIFMAGVEALLSASEEK